jgi:hypothetical protein
MWFNHAEDIKDSVTWNVFSDMQLFKKLVLGDITILYEGWNFNSGNYLFTTDTK